MKKVMRNVAPILVLSAGFLLVSTVSCFADGGMSTMRVVRVPEPSMFMMLGGLLGGIGVLGRRYFKR